jgi:hypothetical protein
MFLKQFGKKRAISIWLYAANISGKSFLGHGQKWSSTWLPSMRILTQNKNSKWRLLI